MTERERLVEELGNLVKKYPNSGISHKLSYTMKRWELELVAEFIIEDRKRICAPLVRMSKAQAWAIAWKDAGLETLRLARLEEEK